MKKVDMSQIKVNCYYILQRRDDPDQYIPFQAWENKNPNRRWIRAYLPNSDGSTVLNISDRYRYFCLYEISEDEFIVTNIK
tara:strand:- start:1295 stop:1537 length:243 start_codon:yes stop_codon:yes gene_type:complete